MWEHFHHEADIGVRGYGDSPASAFEAAAQALTAVITDPDKVACREHVSIECEAPDLEVLLFDWLNALVYEMATRRMLFQQFRVEISDHRLHASACGESIEVERHQPAAEVKGATYTQLEVREDSSSEWHAQCVVDV
jgi:tRNA nucleotidyltransferase (CCA-adding enzyme)